MITFRRLVKHTYLIGIALVNTHFSDRIVASVSVSANNGAARVIEKSGNEIIIHNASQAKITSNLQLNTGLLESNANIMRVC